jgi:phosphoribosylanthranilate isomerase
MSIRVKICGITNLDDARSAVEAGVHALGFVFYEKSPRFISIQEASNICAALPPFISRVGVFVNELEYTIEKTIAECGLDTLQFHGDEPPGFCQKFTPKAIKAFNMKTKEDLKLLQEYDVDAWLLDAHSDSARGGTGQTFNWNLAVEANKLGAPIILSGGLNPQNVQEAIRTVQPYAVDASSGLEVSPGKKDPQKVAAFLQACRQS